MKNAREKVFNWLWFGIEILEFVLPKVENMIGIDLNRDGKVGDEDEKK